MKIYNVLRRLWQIGPIGTVRLRREMIVSLCMPIFMYCYVVQWPLDCDSKRKMQMAFNACVRYVYKIPRYDHISEYSDKILECNFFTYMENFSLVFLRKLLMTGVPQYLREKLSHVSSTRTQHINIRRHATAQMANSFFVYGVRQWNRLPLNLRNQNSVESFRKDCLNFLMNNA